MKLVQVTGTKNNPYLGGGAGKEREYFPFETHAEYLYRNQWDIVGGEEVEFQETYLILEGNETWAHAPKHSRCCFQHFIKAGNFIFTNGMRNSKGGLIGSCERHKDALLTLSGLEGFCARRIQMVEYTAWDYHTREVLFQKKRPK